MTTNPGSSGTGTAAQDDKSRWEDESTTTMGTVAHDPNRNRMLTTEMSMASSIAPSRPRATFICSGSMGRVDLVALQDLNRTSAPTGAESVNLPDDVLIDCKNTLQSHSIAKQMQAAYLSTVTPSSTHAIQPSAMDLRLSHMDLTDKHDSDSPADSALESRSGTPPFMVDNAQQYDVPIIYEVGGQPAVLVPLPLQDATGEVTANTAPMRSWWKQRRFLYGLGVVFMAVSIMIALLGTIIDGFCGVRGCSSASHPVNRVVQIVHFRNTITLTGQNLSLYDPFFDPPDAASREERIMAWLIEDDNLQLTTGAPFSQFHPKQRYALATLWAQFQEDLFRTDVQKHECEWTGVTCTPVDFGQGIGTVQAVTAIKLSKGTGQIGSDMGLLSHLTTVDFSNNALTGTLPATIGAWTNLESLNLQNNDMFGSLPASIGQWTRLRYMNVADNFGFGKELPTSIEQWTSLEALYLNDNNFIGIVPFGLCGAANLTRIIVDCDDMYCLCGNRNLCQCA